MSAPARICTYMSAFAAVRVSRGSTTMVLGGIAAHDQHHVGVLDVDPAIGHCAASEGGPQTGDRWAVSNAGLVFQVADPQAAHTFYDQVIEFVGVGTAAVPG